MKSKFLPKIFIFLLVPAYFFLTNPNTLFAQGQCLKSNGGSASVVKTCELRYSSGGSPGCYVTSTDSDYCDCLGAPGSSQSSCNCQVGPGTGCVLTTSTVPANCTCSGGSLDGEACSGSGSYGGCGSGGTCFCDSEQQTTCLVNSQLSTVSCWYNSPASPSPTPQGASCGDGSCNGSETCSTCSQDCGSCGGGGAYCGDGSCNGSETCSSCAADCGTCGGGAVCGDAVCNGFETCNTCTSDCGACPADQAWWQVWGGNLFAGLTTGNGIISFIPDSGTCAEPGCTPALVDTDSAGTTDSAGFPITAGGSIDSNGEALTNRDIDISVRGGNPTRLRETYSFFIRAYSLGINPTDTWPNSSSDAVKPTYSQNLESYFHDGDMTIQSAWSVADGESYVVFVDGNLTIQDTAGAGSLINVDEGGFLAFIVSGNIEIDQTVGHTTLSNTSGNVEGVYVADGNISIETNGGLDERFIGEGIFVGWTDVDLQRDYDGGANNGLYPAETFVYRPDFMTNTPEKMKRSQMLWQETN